MIPDLSDILTNAFRMAGYDYAPPEWPPLALNTPDPQQLTLEELEEKAWAPGWMLAELWRPNDSVPAGEPNLAEDVGGAVIESPFFDEARHLATYDLNKELFDDLEGSLTIKIGRGYSK